MTASTVQATTFPSYAGESAEDLAKSFHKNGFVIVPAVLSPEEVQSLRAFLRPKYDIPAGERYEGDTKQYLFDPFSRYPETRILFKKRAIDVVTAILGARPALVREFAAQYQNYSGWHKDTSCLERAGLSYHWEKDFSFLTFTCYLQDNDPETGGGLDIAPGSETWPDRYVKAKPKKETRRPSIWDKILGRKTEIRNDYGYEITDYENFYTIPSKAGDLILFNRKIDHRATVNKSGEPQEKMGIFGSFSRNDKHLAAYHDFIGHRADYYYLKNFAYPADFVAEAAAAGLDLI
jgi:hypothetical protein